MKKHRRVRRHRTFLFCIPVAAVLLASVLLAQNNSGGTDWHLWLVNPWNEMPEGYVPGSFTDIGNGQSVDSRCADDLLQMLDACAEDGLSPVVCSSYRTQETQQALFDNKIQRVMAEQGCDEAEAEKIAATVVARPGTSEHQLGLAVDIVDESYQALDEAQEQTAVQQWLMEHSWEYGFILRYPNGESETTGIIYEPWHYRYVGRNNAKKIYESGLCLEDYLAQN